MALFSHLHESGRTILMVTHERWIAKRADRIVHLLDGELAEIEEPGGDSA